MWDEEDEDYVANLDDNQFDELNLDVDWDSSHELPAETCCVKINQRWLQILFRATKKYFNHFKKSMLWMIKNKFYFIKNDKKKGNINFRSPQEEIIVSNI